MKTSIIPIPNRDMLRIIKLERLVEIIPFVVDLLKDKQIVYVCKEPCIFLPRSAHIYEFEILFLSIFKRQGPFIFLDDRWQFIIRPFFQFVCFLINNSLVDEDTIDNMMSSTTFYDLYTLFKL